MRAYIAHNMDNSEDLRTRLETAESEVTAARKLTKKRVGLLRRAEKEKKIAQVEARWLAEEKEAMKASKKKVEEEAKQLRQELQELQVGFAVKN